MLELINEGRGSYKKRRMTFYHKEPIAYQQKYVLKNGETDTY
jgi:hypothetical protein